MSIFILVEAIQLGDRVYAQSPETGESSYFEVTALHAHIVDEVINITIDGGGGGDSRVHNAEIMTVTRNHPIYVEGRGWVDAEDLALGDTLRRKDGGIATILAIDHVSLDTPQVVYNLTVAGVPCYALRVDFTGELG